MESRSSVSLVRESSSPARLSLELESELVKAAALRNAVCLLAEIFAHLFSLSNQVVKLSKREVEALESRWRFILLC